MTDTMVQKDQFGGIQVEKALLLSEILPADINRLFDDFERNHIEFGLPWLRILADTTSNEDEQVYLYIARGPDDSLVALPLRVSSRKAHAQSLTNFYSSLYSPVSTSASPSALISAIFLYLARVEKITSIALSPMEANGHLYKAINNAMHSAGWRGIHTWNCFANWSHTISDHDFELYLKGRPSALKNTVRRKSRKLLELESGAIRICTSPDDLSWGIPHYLEVYHNSWKQEEPYPRFIPELLRLAADRGWLRLGILYHEGKAIAAQIWLVSSDKASIFKLAYDNDYKRLSPGTVLTAKMAKHVIEEDRVELLDYLTGDDPFKRDWMSHRVTRRGIAAYNTRTLRGYLEYLAHSLKSGAKQLLQRGTGGTGSG